ncbi:MAG: hypothetical protein U1E97_00135 [Alphaproteobacteria bacterium]
MKAEFTGSVPPPTAPTATASAVLAPLVRNVVLPPALTAGLERILIGTVVAQDSHGQVTVETKDGELRFVSRLALPPGTRVTLELQSVGATLNAIILSINGRLTGSRPGLVTAEPFRLPGSEPASAGPLAQGTGGQQPPVSRAITPAPTGPPILAPGQTLRGTVRAPALPTATKAAVPQTPIVIRILTVTAGSPSSPAIPAPATPLASAGDVPTVTGVVARMPETGEPVLRTPFGTISVPIPATLPPGSEVAFEILPLLAAPTAPDRSQIAAEIANTWSSLRDALTALRPDRPAAAEALANRVLARPGPNLAGDLFAYIFSLKSRSARTWLGESTAVALEQAGRPDILARITDEFSLMTRLAHDTPTGDWRTYLVPIYHSGEIQPLRFFLRRPKGQRDSDPATRFVVEAELKSLGLLQLDGLSHRHRLDMIIRTHEPLPEVMRDDINALFNASCAAARLDGSISFQANSIFTVAPLEDLVPSSGGVVV